MLTAADPTTTAELLPVRRLSLTRNVVGAAFTTFTLIVASPFVNKAVVGAADGAVPFGEFDTPVTAIVSEPFRLVSLIPLMVACNVRATSPPAVPVVAEVTENWRTAVVTFSVVVAWLPGLPSAVGSPTAYMVCAPAIVNGGISNGEVMKPVEASVTPLANNTPLELSRKY